MEVYFWLVIGLFVALGSAFLGGVVWGGTTARQKMAAELCAIYHVCGADGSRAKQEVRDAIKLIMDEFVDLKGKSSVVWLWVHKTISKL